MRRHLVVGAHVIDEGLQPRRIAGRGARDVHRQRQFGMGMQLRDRHFERMAVDEAHEAQLLRGRNELAGGRDRAVGADHAQQAFVMHGLRVLALMIG
jgi:uncharacterized protein (DUF2336 family)